MTDPVTADDGHNYQRIELRRTSHTPTYYSPFTGYQIHTYTPNKALRETIASMYFLFYYSISSIIIALFPIFLYTSLEFLQTLPQTTRNQLHW